MTQDMTFYWFFARSEFLLLIPRAAQRTIELHSPKILSVFIIFFCDLLVGFVLLGIYSRSVTPRFIYLMFYNHFQPS